MSIHIGSWAIPAVVTVASFAYALWPERDDGYGMAIIGLLFTMVAAIVSMAAWLVWALFA